MPVRLQAAQVVAEELSRDADLRAQVALLAGGADLDPALYGEAPHPSVSVEGARDDLELSLLEEALARQKG